jgi:hypothetical protein
MPKKTTASAKHGDSTGRKTATAAKSRAAAADPKAKAVRKGVSAKGAEQKHVGDVLGISRARVSKSVPSGGRRPKGIELPSRSTTGLKPLKVVGGVRGRGR